MSNLPSDFSWRSLIGQKSNQSETTFSVSFSVRSGEKVLEGKRSDSGILPFQSVSSEQFSANRIHLSSSSSNLPSRFIRYFVTFDTKIYDKSFKSRSFIVSFFESDDTPVEYGVVIVFGRKGISTYGLVQQYVYDQDILRISLILQPLFIWKQLNYFHCCIYLIVFLWFVVKWSDFSGSISREKQQTPVRWSQVESSGVRWMESMWSQEESEWSHGVVKSAVSPLVDIPSNDLCCWTNIRIDYEHDWNNPS